MQLFKTGEESVGFEIKEPRGTKKLVAMSEKRECLSFKLPPHISTHMGISSRAYCVVS